MGRRCISSSRNLGRVIELPLPEAAGVFQWTSLGESDLQGQPRRLKFHCQTRGFYLSADRDPSLRSWS